MEQWIEIATATLREWAPMGGQILSIIWINILLSGDNAVVIAMACRALPPRQRMIGIMLGAGAAVVLRVVFTVALQYLLGLPWLRLIGGLLLVYIAVKLLAQDDGGDEDAIAGSDNVWDAVKTVAIADMVMSLDNVLAIAGAAKGHPWLIVFGLVISIPLIVAGATLIMSLLTRFPVLVWAGAALLGWIAGELVLEDPISNPFFEAIGAQYGLGHHAIELTLKVAGAAIVLLIGWTMARKAARKHGETA
ncbi:MAG: TerC family protein [Hyphomicrobiaceae bacterium]|nr:TerC family protein [Hyphomicrobiaceae bacterium]